MADNRIQNKAMQARQASTTQTPPSTQPAKQTVTALLNSMLDSEGYRKRFDELLGKRTPQFMSSIVSMVNGTPALNQAFMESPITIIQSALRAAAYDLPIDPGLGYAYIVPFNNKKKRADGSVYWAHEAQFIMGYKGMIQLAQRTGAYKTINVRDVRQGELIRFDPLREESEFAWIEDEDERERLPIVGWVGFFKLVNGAEKTVYMSRKAINQHEIKNRKGKPGPDGLPPMGKGWKDDYNAMAEKTVLRRLIGKWGLMSIDYQQATPAAIAAAEAISKGQFDDEDKPDTSDPVVGDAIEGEFAQREPESVEPEREYGDAGDQPPPWENEAG